MRRLILFDIDGTLVRPTGVGRRSLERTFEERYGAREAFLGMRFHGRTDPDIVLEGLSRIGKGPAEIQPAIAHYLRHLRSEVARIQGSILLPGVRELLKTLRATPDVVLGLVTGNVREGAEIKLGKDSIFDWFEVGGFGDDSTDRAELIRMARRRALERQLGPFESGRVFHVGDTANDILAAQGAGAVAVAVATGSVPRSELAELSPDFLRDGFEPVTPFLAEVLA